MDIMTPNFSPWEDTHIVLRCTYFKAREQILIFAIKTGEINAGDFA